MSSHIVSPMPEGSGAVVVHRQLEAAIEGYRVAAYPPAWEYWPFRMRALVDQHADLVHTTPDFAPFCAPRHIPLVLTLHGYTLDPEMLAYSSPAQRLHYRTMLRYCTRVGIGRAAMITAVSEFTAAVARRDLRYEGDIRVIRNGVDTDYFQPVSRRGHRAGAAVSVLFSGNPSPKKGVDLLPKIAERLPAHVEIRYTGGLRGGKELVGPRLIALGRVPREHMPELYRSADICLLPTVREGFSLAVLEAMACGLPVVATDCASLPEQIVDGKGGFLCSVNDADDFADKLKMLISDPALRRAMGDYNRQRVSDCFGLRQMTRAYSAIFEEVLDSR